MSSSKRVSFEAKLHDGDLIVPYAGKFFMEKLSGYDGKQKAVIVTIEIVGKGKAKMLAFYHSVVLDVARTMFRDAGNIIDEEGADLALKSMFASSTIINPVTKKEEKVLLSKADMNFERLNQYLNDCIMFLEDNGYQVPEPINDK